MITSQVFFPMQEFGRVWVSTILLVPAFRAVIDCGRLREKPLVALVVMVPIIEPRPGFRNTVMPEIGVEVELGITEIDGLIWMVWLDTDGGAPMPGSILITSGVTTCWLFERT